MAMNLRLRPETAAQVKALAERDNVSAHSVICTAVDTYLLERAHRSRVADAVSWAIDTDQELLDRLSRT